MSDKFVESTVAMTTTVTVEIGSSHGAGLDNYLATVFRAGRRGGASPRRRRIHRVRNLRGRIP